MGFLEKVKSKEFWEEVRTNPAYDFLVKELLDIYQRDAQGEIKDISYDAFMEFYRTGSRLKFEWDYYFPRRRRLNACALLSLIYPDREEYFDNLMNTIWAICNEYCWSLPTHTPKGDEVCNDWYIDLFAAETGFALSEIRFLLGERMSPLMNDRIRQELEKRIIRSFLDHPFNWEQNESNWAGVCGGSVGCVFLYERPDLFEEAKPRIDSTLATFLRSYKADGVCREGLDYWQYGFGFFVAYAQRLLEHTRGKENLFALEHVKQIAQFPAMAFLDGAATISFSDCPREGRVGLGTVSILRRHYGELMQGITRNMCMTNDDCGRWPLHVDSIVWFEPEFHDAEASKEAVYYKEDSGWFVKKCAAYSFAAKGGSNYEPHNHNDVGSFILCHGGGQILTDLGRGLYTADYFGEKRYEHLCRRSGGHSVPMVDGLEQVSGRDTQASTAYEEGKLTIDLTGAYPASRVKGVLREFTFTENSVKMRDQYTYGDNCKTYGAVKERLVSLVKPVVKEDRVELDELQIRFSPGWQVQVTQDLHVTRSEGETVVYLIDFTTEQPMQEFQVEFVV